MDTVVQVSPGGLVRRQLLLGGAVLVLAFVVYFPLRNAGFVWDDDNYVTENSCLRDLSGLVRLWVSPTALPQYYPLVHTTFWVEYQLWGLWPLGYHIDNVLLHAVNALLFASLLRKLRIPGGGFAAVVFAVHPVHVESVSWVTERKNLLSAFFYLASLISFLLFSESPEKKRYWIRSLLFYFAALLSKTVTATLPPVLLVILWWRHGRIDGRAIRAILPFFFIGVPFGLLTVWLERHHVGAIGAAWDFSLSQRFLIAGNSIWFHLGKLIWPQPLAFVYPKFPLDTAGGTWALAPLAVLLTIGVLSRFRTTTEQRAWLACFLIFCGTMFPALGFFDVFPMQYTYVADHYQYIASMAPIALLASLLWRHAGRRGPIVTGVLVCVVTVLLGVRTNIESEKFRNVETLWRDTLQKNPRCSMAHTNLGNELRSQGRDYLAAREYRLAVQCDPGDLVPVVNLAGMLLSKGDTAPACQMLTEVLDKDPDQELALYNMGLILAQEGDRTQALSFLRRATMINPRHAPAFNAMGIEYADANMLFDALDCFEEAHRISPSTPDFLVNLGVIQLMLGDTRMASKSLEESLLLSPEHLKAMINLADCYVTLKRWPEATDLARSILRIDSENSVALRILNETSE